MSASASTEQLRNKVAQRTPAQPSPFAQVDAWIERMKPQIARALPEGLRADRVARILLNEVRRTPLLARCTTESFGGAVMTCAQLGLEPGAGTGEAYLLPFKNNKKNIYEVQLVIGYQGMVKLFWQSPLAKSIDAQVVYEHDHFAYAYGLEPKLEHRPTLGDRGRPVAYYAVATLTTGGSAFVVLSPGDVQRIRERSKAKDDGPWKTDPDAMARKTAIRQLFKLLPKSPEMHRALAQDGAVREDSALDAIDIVPSYDVEGEVVREQETSSATPPAEGEPAPAAADGESAAPEPGFDPVTGEVLPETGA